VEQVVLYLSVLVAFVVEVIDAAFDWLASRRLSGWLLVIGVSVAIGFHRD
jgi:hypothetical protein